MFGRAQIAIPPLIDRGKLFSEWESKANLFSDFFSRNSNLDPCNEIIHYWSLVPCSAQVQHTLVLPKNCRA